MALKFTALYWWIDRWRKSSAFMDMTLEQQGAYRNLLDEAALRGGPLPNDERVLAKACGDATRWKQLRDVILVGRFELKDDGWHNDTLDEVLAESRRRSDKQRRFRLTHQVSNDKGNARGNGAGNAHGNEDRHIAGNKPRPPDLDLDLHQQQYGNSKD